MLHRAVDVRLRMVGALVLAAVGLQIAYVLTGGVARVRLTVGIVLVVAAASLSHAMLTRGGRGLLCFAVAAVVGFGADVLGVHTGVPFGDYRYSGTLGVEVASVPLLAALAWAMLAWPAALVARRLATTTPIRVLVGAWALASWDLFLDPQLVAAGAWRWTDPNPHLPGEPAVALTNYAGWLLVATLISLAVQWILAGTPAADDRWMFALYVWIYLSSIVGLAAFLHLPAAAFWGALGMGVVAVPLMIRCL
jgi:putative membrane protein